MQITKKYYRATFDAEPSDDELESCNALESSPMKPQTPSQVGLLLMNWMDREGFNFERTADIIGIPRPTLINIINGRQFSDDIRLALSNTIPGIYI